MLRNPGDDLLRGNKGDDLLKGDKGYDTFLFSKGDGADTIKGFNANFYTIKIRRGADDLSELTVEQVGKHLEIGFSNVTVTLHGLPICPAPTAHIFEF